MGPHCPAQRAQTGLTGLWVKRGEASEVSLAGVLLLVVDALRREGEKEKVTKWDKKVIKSGGKVTG